MPEKATIGLDYSHNNKLTLEASSFNEFTHFLFTSGYKLGKIQAGFDSLKKLEGYDAIIISTPNNQRIESDEIKIIEKYVKEGGSLLVLSSLGGDYTNKTNLNELTHQFGFEFVSDEVNDSMNYINLQKRPILTDFIPHVVTEQVRKIVYSSACSIRVLDFIEDDTDIKIEVVVNSGINCWHRRFEADDDEWIDEDYSKMPLMVVIEYFKGKVIGFGNLSMFSSLGREYGFSAFDNDIIIANILQWLTSGAISEGKVVTVNLNLDLFYWINRILNEDNWDNVSAIVNVSLKYFKDNYKEIIDEIKRLKMQKSELRKAYQKTKEDDIEAREDKILELIPERKKEDLEDIMSALEEVTGEKYELSLDLEEEETDSEKEVEEELAEEEVEYTEKDVNKFQKDTSKHAIWHGKPTKAFKDWLREK